MLGIDQKRVNRYGMSPKTIIIRGLSHARLEPSLQVVNSASL